MRNLHSFAARFWRRHTVWVVARFAVGLGANEALRQTGVGWLGGAIRILDNVAANQVFEVVEP